ncbi:MAG: hypothetical protein ACRCU9_09095 [Iodobacter sp.]
MKNLSLIGALLILAVVNKVQAHDGSHEEEGGATQISAVLNLRYLSGESAWPAPLPVLGAGQEDRRGGWYGGSGLAWHQQWLTGLSSDLMLAYDDHEKAMVVDHASVAWATGPSRLTLGRQSPAFASAGLKAWALPDLWLHTALADDHWHEDGLAFSYLAGDLTAEAGVFNGHGYPGADGALWTAGLSWKNGPWSLSTHAAFLPQLSRSLVSDGHTGHSHGSQLEGCGQQVDCFAGQATLLRATAGWQWEQYWLQSAVGWQKQTGDIASTLGKVDYQGELTGLALEGGVKLTPGLSLAIRHEWMGITHQLAGANSSLIALKNGIANSDQKPWQTGMRLAWQAHPAHLLALELYQTERNGLSDRLAMLQWEVNYRLY